MLDFLRPSGFSGKAAEYTDAAPGEVTPAFTVFAAPSVDLQRLHPSWEGRCIIQLHERAAAPSRVIHPEGVKGSRHRHLTIDFKRGTDADPTILRSDGTEGAASTLIDCVREFVREFKAATELRDGLRDLHAHLTHEKAEDRRIRTTDDILSLALGGEPTTTHTRVKKILVEGDYTFRAGAKVGNAVVTSDPGEKCDLCVRIVKVTHDDANTVMNNLPPNSDIVLLMPQVGVEWPDAALADLWTRVENFHLPHVMCLPSNIHPGDDELVTRILLLAVQRASTRIPIKPTRSLAHHLHGIEAACNTLHIKASQMA